VSNTGEWSGAAFAATEPGVVPVRCVRSVLGVSGTIPERGESRVALTQDQPGPNDRLYRGYLPISDVKTVNRRGSLFPLLLE
jgi:hypothetical protein